MGTTIAALEGFLPADIANRAVPSFEPSARYYSPMDYVMYLEEDVAYRADRVDRFLTLLWHPYEDRAIGVKLKGFRFIFERMLEILRANGVNISQERFVPLTAVFEVTMTAGLGAALIATAEKQRIDERYAKARDLVKNVQFDARELLEAA